jgi:hypothetical protein
MMKYVNVIFSVGETVVPLRFDHCITRDATDRQYLTLH